MEPIPPLAFLLVILTAPLAYNAPTTEQKSSETYVQELLELSKNCSFPSQKIFNEPDPSWSDQVNSLCSGSSEPSKLCGVLTGAVHLICKTSSSRQEVKFPTTRQEVLLKVKKDDVEDGSKFCKRLDRPVPIGVVGVDASLLKNFTAGQTGGPSECVKSCWNEVGTPEDFKVESLCVLTLTALELIDANKADANNVDAKSVAVNAKNADVSASSADVKAKNADANVNNDDANASSPDASGVSSSTVKGTGTNKSKKGGQDVEQMSGSESVDNPLAPAVVAAGISGGSASEDEDNEGTVDADGRALKVTALPGNPDKSQPRTSLNLPEDQGEGEEEDTPKSPKFFASSAQAGTGDSGKTQQESPDKRMPTASVKLQSVSQTSEKSDGSESKLPSSASSNPITSSQISSSSPSNQIPVFGEISTGKAIMSSQTVDQSEGQMPPGSPQEKSGPVDEKTGLVEEKTGPTDEKTEPAEEKAGPADEKTEPADEPNSSSASSTSSKRPAEESENNPSKVDEGSDVLQKPMGSSSSDEKAGGKQQQNVEDSDTNKFPSQKFPLGGNPDPDGDDDLDGLDDIPNGGSDVSETDQRPRPISQSTGRNVMQEPHSFNNVISGVPYESDSDSGFMRHAMIFLVISGVCWVLFHNRKRMIAMIVEGRRPKTHRSNANGSRRSSKGAVYRKLENNFD